MIKKIFTGLFIASISLNSVHAYADQAGWKQHTQAGHALNDQGNYDAAKKEYQAALEEAKAISPESFQVSASLNNLADIERSKGNFDEALALFNQSLEMLKTVSPNDPMAASVLNNMATLYAKKNQYDKAEQLYKESLAITEKAYGKNHFHYYSTLSGLADVYSEEGKFVEAEKYSKEALDLAIKNMPPNSIDLATGYNNLAVAYQRNKKYSEAQPLLEKALEIAQNALGPDNPRLSSPLNNLATLYARTGQMDKAVSTLERALVLAKNAWGSDNPDVQEIEKNLAGIKEYRNNSKVFPIQNTSTTKKLPHQAISDKEVTVISQVARENITRAKLQDGSFVPSETEAEKAKPLFPASYNRQIIEHGALSDMMETCGLDWKPGFIAMIDDGLSKGITPKQRAYMGLLHGVSMGYYEKPIKEKGCTSAMKTYFGK